MKKIVVSVIISFFISSAFIEARELSKSDFIEDINIMFLKEDYRGLTESANNNLGKLRLTRQEKKEILYLMGLSYIKTGDFSKARKAFGDILDKKGDELRQDAYIGIADSYFIEKNYDKAIKSYESILNMYPKSDRLSSVYYNLAGCYKAKNNNSKANLYLDKVKKGYDTSFESGKAEYLPTKTTTRYYIVQLGAFKRLKNAKKLVKSLARKKYDSYVQKIEKDGRTYYRVRCGKFSNEYYAKRLVRRLRKNRFSAKIIVE